MDPREEAVGSGTEVFTVPGADGGGVSPITTRHRHETHVYRYQGVFAARVTRVPVPVSYVWKLNGNTLSEEGSIAIGGSTIDYEAGGRILRTRLGEDVSGSLCVAATDARGDVHRRCVSFVLQGRIRSGGAPTRDVLGHAIGESIEHLMELARAGEPFRLPVMPDPPPHESRSEPSPARPRLGPGDPLEARRPGDPGEAAVADPFDEARSLRESLPEAIERGMDIREPDWRTEP